MNKTRLSSKDISNKFDLIRKELDRKENELIQLEKGQNGLLMIDKEQFENILTSINVLHLITEDGSFLFPSKNEQFHQNNDQQENNSNKDLSSNSSLRLPFVEQLFSFPLNVFLSTSKSSTKTVEQKIFNLNQSQTEISHQNENENETKSQKSNSNNSSNEVSTLLLPGSIYSKEFWLNKSNKQHLSNSDQEKHFDLDLYLQQSSENIRRIHGEYLSSIEQIKKSSINDDDSLSNIKTIYPKIFQGQTRETKK